MRLGAIITLLLFALLAGCTHYAGIIDDWVGHTEQELKEKWGEPDSRSRRGKGELLTYERYWEDTKGTLNRGRLKFLIDENGTILDSSKSNFPDYLFGDQILSRP